MATDQGFGERYRGFTGQNNRFTLPERVVSQFEICCAEGAKQTRMSDVGGKADIGGWRFFLRLQIAEGVEEVFRGVRGERSSR